MIPQNFDNDQPLVSMDPVKFSAAHQKVMDRERLEERRERGGTTVDESLACLAEWAEFRKECKCKK